MQNVIRENKICKCCGKEFIPTTARQIFCCKQCSAYYHNHKRSPVRESKQCVICGTEFMPRNNRQVTCGKAECVKGNEKNVKAKKAYSYKRPAYETQARKKKRYSKTGWESLTPCQRWELMSLTELSGEIARLFPGKSFGDVRLLKEQGKLPDEFGKRCR